MRILALDYGERRIGLAVSDPLGFTAQGLEAFTRRRWPDETAHFAQLCQQYDVGQLVMGLPVHMNGQVGEKAEIARRYGDALSQALQLPIAYMDERLTTVQAHRLMQSGNASRSQHKNSVDMLSACLILENYMAREKNRMEEK